MGAREFDGGSQHAAWNKNVEDAQDQEPQPGEEYDPFAASGMKASFVAPGVGEIEGPSTLRADCAGKVLQPVPAGQAPGFFWSLNSHHPGRANADLQDRRTITRIKSGPPASDTCTDGPRKGFRLSWLSHQHGAAHGYGSLANAARRRMRSSKSMMPVGPSQGYKSRFSNVAPTKIPA